MNLQLISTLADVAQAAGFSTPEALAAAAGCTQRKPVVRMWHNQRWRIRTCDLAALCHALGDVQPGTFLVMQPAAQLAPIESA